ncbi:MAG: cell division protein FtsA [bacterium]
MAREVIAAGLDLGDSRIKCVIALRHADGQVDVIGTGVHPANGFQNGAVQNPDEAVASIRKAVEEAELMAGCEIHEVYLAASSRHFETFDSTGMTRIVGEAVTEADVRAAIDMAEAVRMGPDQRVLHVVPQEFVVDGQRGIRQPLGTPGVRLEVRAHLVLGNAPAIETLEACCRRARLAVLDVFVSPLAQAECLLTPQSRDVGVAVVDIGSDTTDVVVFERGAIAHTAVLAIGGDHITADIRDCLNTPTAEAEHLKRAHGTALAHVVDPDEIVEVPGVGGRRPRPVKRALLCEIIEARVEEIFRLVADELSRAGYREDLAGGVILTGGTATLHYIEELAEHTLQMPAARGIPRDLHGLVDVVADPKYATATGLVLAGLRERSRDWHAEKLRRVRPTRRTGLWWLWPWGGGGEKRA